MPASATFPLATLDLISWAHAQSAPPASSTPQLITVGSKYWPPLTWSPGWTDFNGLSPPFSHCTRKGLSLVASRLKMAA